ncbi:hypothetical protein BC936DRAFT_143922 [Jimgerdemannia flammicorona]|uniref:Uncharacterized protein n=2 Tax=Jimgerdemannia flammicorona TaxID=994334 RepID=A0A433DD84_9FUNG|nr:hypothetical protein BC936DRAFT_143922 [Jimgerdemannia flammicorona]RUS32610.1 hypothetical protein BC938DRAFT_474923 [Jimgerdemannia flammicorona]
MSTEPQDEQVPRTVSTQDSPHLDPSAGILHDQTTVGIGHVQQITVMDLDITAIMTLEIEGDVDMASVQAWNPIVKGNLRKKMTKGG